MLPVWRCCVWHSRKQLIQQLACKHTKSDINDPDRFKDVIKQASEQARVERAAGAARSYQQAKTDAEHKIQHDLLEDVVVLPGATAMEALIEKQIAASKANGAFDNLKGAGKPLPRKHDEQFARVDPLMSAMSRAMGAADIKPASIEFRDELAEARTSFATAVRQTAAKGPKQRQAVLSGDDAGLNALWKYVLTARKSYNDACLADKECWGSAWPLHPIPTLRYDKEVEEILQEP